MELFLPRLRTHPCTFAGLIVLSGEAGSDLASLNATTGAVKWSFTGAPGRQGEALCWEDGLAQDVMWLTEQGIRRIEGATGKILWTWDAPV